MKTKFTPAYFPAGDVAVVPLKPTNCGPVQASGRLLRAKFPAASDTVVKLMQVVVFPLPSFPNVVMVTPASGVSVASATTVRPTSEVVGAATASDTDALSVTASPSMVALAEIERLDAAIGWPLGAVRVRTEV